MSMYKEFTLLNDDEEWARFINEHCVDYAYRSGPVKYPCWGHVTSESSVDYLYQLDLLQMLGDVPVVIFTLDISEYGHNVLWWKKESTGYSADFKDAHVYTRREAESRTWRNNEYIVTLDIANEIATKGIRNVMLTTHTRTFITM